MDHIAIDLGGRESQVCIRKADGSIVREQRVKTKSLPHLLAEQASPCRVIVETSAEAFAIADAALEAGHQVKVVPATLVTALGWESDGPRPIGATHRSSARCPAASNSRRFTSRASRRAR